MKIISKDKITNTNKSVKVTIFIGDIKINNLLHSVDMNDCGTKLFGNLVSFEFVKPNKFNKKQYAIKMFKNLEKEFIVGAVIIENISIINDNYKMFSDGKKFIFVDDLEKHMIDM